MVSLTVGRQSFHVVYAIGSLRGVRRSVTECNGVYGHTSVRGDGTAVDFFGVGEEAKGLLTSFMFVDTTRRLCAC